MEKVQASAPLNFDSLLEIEDLNGNGKVEESEVSVLLKGYDEVEKKYTCLRVLDASEKIKELRKLGIVTPSFSGFRHPTVKLFFDSYNSARTVSAVKKLLALAERSGIDVHTKDIYRKAVDNALDQYNFLYIKTPETSKMDPKILDHQRKKVFREAMELLQAAQLPEAEVNSWIKRFKSFEY